ncbi:TolC family protein [Fibrella sp. HMF5335]|uniref:TolC family protein n=1 Tax=Fibrella rubiginis TaxID=2817060 RepID=A0A939GI10_9BACT|nr:TolC family protein [Fibrella rubiginis]MBO0936843.1 TolC family protein [Fibrella rubiginis]
MSAFFSAGRWIGGIGIGQSSGVVARVAWRWRASRSHKPKQYIALVAFILLSISSLAQDTTTFTAADFFDAVLKFHPIVRQANLFPEQARAEIMEARGAFDPKLGSYYDRKEFGSKLYYDRWQTGLSVPIRAAGVDLKVEYDRAVGQAINPEISTPPTGLMLVGLSVPVGQTLLIDGRRTALRQAQAGVGLAEADQRKQINKALYDAAKAYWEWYLAYRAYALVDEGLNLANVRFTGTRQRALIGEAATIDTTEALITVQDRLVQRQQAEVDLQNARLRLSVFLWGPNNQPIDLPANVIPQQPETTDVGETTVQRLLSQALKDHPELAKIDAKTTQNELEVRFRRALVQPQIALNASLLSQTPDLGRGYDWSSYYAFSPGNHKIGLDLVFPLFLRKERGKLRQVQLKGQQLTLDRQQTTRDIQNDILTARNELLTLQQQIRVQEQTVANQRRLVQAEQQRFTLGESSLFLVNARESKLIDLGVKLEELRTKYQKAIAGLWYAAGTLPVNNR